MKIMTLGEVCARGSSNIAQKDLDGNTGCYPIYGASGFIKNVDFYHQDKEYIAVVKDGAGIGRAMLLPAKSSVIGTMQYLIPNSDSGISTKYLYYVITAMDLAKYFSGATIPHIYFKDYQKELIRVPDRMEQDRIARIFEKIDATIALRNEQLVRLDELVRSRFIEMFGEYSEVAKLSDVAKVSGGLTKNSKRNTLPLHMPYLRVANVAFASIDITEMLDIGLTEEEFKKTVLHSGDLLFVEGNGSPDQIGRVAIWKDEIKPCVHQNHLIKTRFRKNRIMPVFAMYYFMSQKGREQIKGQAVSTSGLYTLSVSKIENLLIPVPPMELQNQFAAFVQATDKSKAAIQHSLDELEILKKSLMQQYFG